MLTFLIKNLVNRLGRNDSTAASTKQNVTSTTDDWLSKARQLHEAGRYDELENLCRIVLTRYPDDINALSALASALLAQDKASAAIIFLQQAATIAPATAGIHVALAEAHAAAGDVDLAIESYRTALSIDPSQTDVSKRLAALLTALWRYDEAEDCVRSALRVVPARADLLQISGDVLFEQGRVDEAIELLRNAIAIQANDAALHSDLLRMLCYTDAVTPLQLFDEHRIWAERHASLLENNALPHDNTRDPSRPLRIGYVSPWFRKHAVTFFMEPVIEFHDREQSSIYLYADVAQEDEYSRRLQQHGAIWRPTLDLNDEQLAQLIRDDDIDILVDLTGHTRGNRLLCFAQRPAPVQVNWLGFPCSTGMSSMNYRITDAYCDPPGATEHLNSEKLQCLPRIYMAWRPPDSVPDVGPLPALTNCRITFGSFHSCYKITPTTVALWSSILARVADSRLMMLAVDGTAAQHRLLELFAAHGIDKTRLQFVPRLKFDEYFAAHLRADIALDTFPYHGATTTCACLWMGLPVVALAGANHASRADVSMLSNLGLPQLVAASAEEYIRIAVELASDLPALAAMRAGLRQRMQASPLVDGRSCAHDLEQAFRHMWSAWCTEGANIKPL